MLFPDAGGARRLRAERTASVEILPIARNPVGGDFSLGPREIQIAAADATAWSVGHLPRVRENSCAGGEDRIGYRDHSRFRMRLVIVYVFPQAERQHGISSSAQSLKGPAPARSRRPGGNLYQPGFQ